MPETGGRTRNEDDNQREKDGRKAQNHQATRSKTGKRHKQHKHAHHHGQRNAKPKRTHGHKRTKTAYSKPSRKRKGRQGLLVWCRTKAPPICSSPLSPSLSTDQPTNLFPTMASTTTSTELPPLLPGVIEASSMERIQRQHQEDHRSSDGETASDEQSQQDQQQDEPYETHGPVVTSLQTRLDSICKIHGWEHRKGCPGRTGMGRSSRKSEIRRGDATVEFSLTDGSDNIIVSSVVHDANSTPPPPPARTVSPEYAALYRSRKRREANRSRESSRDSSPVQARRRPSYSLMTKMMKLKAILSERHEQVQISLFDGKFILFHTLPTAILEPGRVLELETTIQDFLVMAVDVQRQFIGGGTRRGSSVNQGSLR